MRAFAAAFASLIVCVSSAYAVEWEEHLVTAADPKVVKLGDARTIMGYYGTGAGLLVHGGKRAPLGHYECAGIVDVAADGNSLDLHCLVTDLKGDNAYLSVRREKSDTFAAGTGVYTYSGGTGAWADFKAECTYRVDYARNQIHGIEQGLCKGDALPPPLR
jgi:hypothetical protein